MTTSSLRQLALKSEPPSRRELSIAIVTLYVVVFALLAFKAVDYLQGKYGSMEGHVSRFQDVLAGHLKNAKILDANFDGKLDKNDLDFTKGANGKVNVEKIGAALRDKVAATR